MRAVSSPSSTCSRITDKTVLRTGYGLFFDALPAQSQTYNNTLNQWPYSAGFNNTANRFSDPVTRIESLQGAFPKPLPASTPWTTAEVNARRFSAGFHALVSYTFSKAIDTGSRG